MTVHGKWLENEISFLKIYWTVLTDDEMSIALNRTGKSVFMKRQRLRLIQGKSYMKTEKYKQIMKEANKKRYIKHPELKIKLSNELKYRYTTDNRFREKISRTWFTSDKTQGKNNYWYGKKRNRKLNPRYIDGRSKERDYERTYSIEWKVNRRKALDRDKKCVNCGSVSDLVVHHIVPFRLSKSHSLSNLVILCNKCHPRIENTIAMMSPSTKKHR